MKDGETWKLSQALRPLIVNVDFTRAGKTLFHSTTFAGFVGVHTAMKPGAFSLTIDTRFDKSMDLSLIRWVEEKEKDTDAEISLLNRKVFQDEETYASALAALDKTKVIGPAYIILSGTATAEGAVITKGKSSMLGKDGQTVDVWQLADVISQNNTYFLLETNYDHTGPAPKFDNRRDPARACMHELDSAEYDFASLYNVLNAKPNLNHLTVFSTLMHAKAGRYEAYREFCVGTDCPLW